jgi:DNA-binding GntR family transcriptional regulator
VGLSDDEIIEWAYSRSIASQIAAELANSIRSGKLARWADLPDNDELARRWDTSMRTVLRAKKLLSDKGLIRMAGNRYCVQ